eukprot:TRINITY_DN6938_c0_g1_i1.p1 TRINITY_DN6938_c0_g1~~TRINITY_DN6938_c0_g1_i1.p1  ORF type:complete len:100 (-),score=13.58 TRINITY_DN6938_c0_g1_i1:3-302(-)
MSHSPVSTHHHHSLFSHLFVHPFIFHSVIRIRIVEEFASSNQGRVVYKLQYLYLFFSLRLFFSCFYSHCSSTNFSKGTLLQKSDISTPIDSPTHLSPHE